MKQIVHREIKVRTQFTGMHHWPDAPAEVGYLRNQHRHVFHVTLTLGVGHNDREKEFFIVQDKLVKFLDSIGYRDGFYIRTVSCEQIATKIGNHFIEDDVTSVEVSEDGENSAVIYYA